MRNPIDRLTAGLPRPWRIAVDWIVTIVGAVAIVLAIKEWVVNPYRIPKSHYYVMGDNRGTSCDSRVWGALPRANLIGKVFAVYWPPRRISLR